MPFDAGTAQGKLDLDTTGFTNAVEKANTALGGFLRGAGNLGKNLLEQGLAVGIGATATALGTLTVAVIAGSRAQAEYEQRVIGLTNLLQQKGVPGFKGIVAGIEEYATAIQRVTGVQDDVTLSIAKMLSVVGVAPQQLRSATQVIIDFAAATGINAETAARLFGRSLQGNAGAIARYLPQVKSLTEAQLRAGEAFNVAREATEGQAAALGESFTGRLNRLLGSVEDFTQLLGKAFNDAFGPLLTEVQGAIDEITDRLSQGVGLEFIQEAAQSAAEAMRGFFVGVLTFGPEAVALFIHMATIVSTLVTLFTALANTILIAFGAFESAEKLAALSGQLAEATTEANKFREQLDKVGDTLDLVVDPSKTLKENIAAVGDAFGLTRKEADRTKEIIKEVSVATGGAAESARKVRDLWKAVNENAETSVGAISEVEGETRSAADAADDLASSFDDVATSAAAATAEVNKQIASLSASRTAGGRTTLDFSDPFRAQALAQQGYQQLGRAGLNAYAGAALINAARAYADGVAGQAQASIDRAFADFTAEVLTQLSAAGVFDPTERNRILRERIAEAQRFGILPEREVRAIY